MNASDIVNVLEALGVTKVRNRGTEVTGNCPVHKDTTQSFGVGVKEGFPFNCFSCIPSSEKVLLRRGHTALKYVIVGDEIWDGFSWQRVIAVKKSRRRDVWEIECYRNRRKLFFTPEHRVFVLREYAIKEVPISNLMEGDYLVYSVRHEEKDILDFDTAKYVGIERTNKPGPNRKNLPLRITLNNAFLRFVGLFIAEGSINASGRNVVFTFAYKEASYAKEVEKVAKGLGFKAQMYPVKSRHRLDVVISSVALVRLMVALCGQGCANKHVPFEWMSLPLKKLDVLFQAVIDGDGCKIGSRIVVDVTSECLTTQMWDWAVKKGFRPSWSENNRASKRKNYIISWSKKAKEWDKPSRKWRKLHSKYYKSKYAFLIKSVTKRLRKSVEVVDIAVKKSSRFVYKGALVHNCHAKGLLPQLVMLVQNCSFREAVSFLQKFGDYEIAPQKDVSALYDARFTQETEEQIGEEVFDAYPFANWKMRQYLKRRGVSSEVYVKANLRRHDERMLFLWYEGLRPAGITSRSFVLEKDPYRGVPYFGFKKHQYVYFGCGARYNKVRRLYVCEGELDCLRLQTCGFEACALSGTHMTKKQSEILLSASEQVVLLLDDDSSGQSGKEQAIKLLADKTVVLIPKDILEEYSDPSASSLGILKKLLAEDNLELAVM